MPPPPSFDSWTIVFLIAAAQGFFTAWVLTRWKQGHRSGNRLLALILCLFSATLVEYVLYWTRYLHDYPHFSNISVSFPFFYGPLLWLYLRTIYHGKAPGRRDIWLGLPGLAVLMLYLPWYGSDAALKQSVMDGRASFPLNQVLVDLQFWASILWMFGFAFWNMYYIYLQPIVGATAKWASRLVWFYLVFVLAWCSYFVLVQFPFFNNHWDYHISAVMTAMIYFIAYSGYAQPAVFQGFGWIEASEPTKYRNSGLTKEASLSLLKKLQELMETEALYQEADINLDKLAGQLHVSRHHLSQVINEQLGTSFFEYVNQLRVEAAKHLLASADKTDFNMIQIAFTVGFNTRMTFNMAFKKSTGMTPTEYRRLCRGGHSGN